MGIRVNDDGELEAALRKVLNHPGPALVEVMTDAELV
jgi:thiamine pyrophosphate-dependent acetolactate synthase large subunit-like protein